MKRWTNNGSFGLVNLARFYFSVMVDNMDELQTEYMLNRKWSLNVYRSDTEDKN